MKRISFMRLDNSPNYSARFRQPRSALFRIATASTLLAVMLAGAMTLGCGYKDWPKPMAAEDVFYLSAATGARRAGCLTAEMNLTGATERLAALAMLVEETPAATYCAGCPFQPSRRIDFALDDPRVMIKNGHLALSWCGAEPNRRYRWQVAGINSLPALPHAVSSVLSD